MMDRNYPTSSFADPLAAPAQTVAWAYDRSSASIKPSSSYGATQLESELLQRQNYTSSHQLPTYTTTHHPAGLSGVFDAGVNTTETSIINFLSAMESRSLQAGPAGTSLLPSFRSSSWPAGANSSTTDLYLTGALPSTATFPSPAALSSYQHVGAFPSRSYAVTSTLGLQDPAFSSTNGLLPHHDPLLHLKPSQAVLPAALAFNHIPASSLGTALPIQSSTYRSAQESAPHLLQPQFSLLPQALASSQSASQPYGPPVFSGSIERALQRECSVIKHHQRPSSSHAAPEQLPSSQHSLQGYLGSGSEGEVSFQQDPSRQTPVPCSPSAGADSAQGVNGTPQPKTQAVLQQSQAYPSSIPSPGYPSAIPSPGYSSSSAGAKTKDCSSKLASHSSEAGGDGHAHSQRHASGSPESYSSPGPKQNSVIASQQSAQLPSLLAISHSQTYITSHSQSQASYSSTDKLPSLYKTLPSFSGQSGNEASRCQSLVYSQSPGQGQGQEAQYVAQAQALCLGNLSQSYPTSHSQGAPNVSYSSQTQGPASAGKSQSYAAGQSLASSYPSSARAQSLLTSNSTQGYLLMHPSAVAVGKTEGGLVQQQQQSQSPKYLLPVPSPTFSSATHAQALQNNIRSSAQDLKPAYGKLKLEDLPIQDLQALQQATLDTSSPTGSNNNNMATHSNVVYVVSKMDDRYNTQSVIRSNSRSEEQQLLGLGPGQTHMAQVKDERMASLGQQHSHSQLINSANSRLVAPNPKTSNPRLLSSHEDLKQHSLLLKAPELQQQNHQALAARPLTDQNTSHGQAAQFIRVPNTQVLLEPNQMILLQQPLIHSGHNNPSKVVSTHMQQNHVSGPVQVQYLHMDGELIASNVNGSHGQQGAIASHQGSGPMDSKQHLPKDPYTQSTNQQSHNNKHQFALNSICFPESMLLADERNILSNVDDILAATAAACGVTPQDFVKATSGAGGNMSTMANPADSKGPFQTVDTRHLSPSFSSPHHSIITNTNSSHALALTLNGGQMTTDGQGQPVRPSNGSDHHVDGRGSSSENDYHLAGQGYEQQNQAKGTTLTLAKGTKCIKREDGLMECPSEGFPKKRARSKSSGQAKLAGLEEDDGQPRLGKRGGGGGGSGGNSQAKRQNSRGSDTSSPSTSDGVYDGYQQQERIRQKIREVEEKQPEVKQGFMGSFLDFLKSGPKQHFSSPPARTASRSRKPSSKPSPCLLPPLPHKLQPPSAPLLPQEGHLVSSQQKRLEEDLQRNLETLPSFSSDEEESVGKNWALQNSISSALSALDEPSDRRHRTDTRLSNSILNADQAPSMPQPVAKAVGQQKDAPKEVAVMAAGKEAAKETSPGQLAMHLSSVAIEGLTDEELSDSGGEGMYRERDEFVVRNEDIDSLQVTLRAGQEPPAIWKVQKALLQKFVPELRDARRVFSATNSYLGYFGDAKTMYRRVYVKFLDTVNKREYVRVCNRKPRCKPMHSMRGSQVKCLLGLKPAPPPMPSAPAMLKPLAKPRPKQSKPRAEPPPKKRRKWKEELSASPSESSTEEAAEENEFNSQVPLGSRFLNTRTMKETFRSFVELLTSVALDADVMSTLEQENDELLLPHMKRVDGMIIETKKRLLPKLHMGQLFKAALDSFPEISVVTELKKDGETPAFKVRLSGKAYNRKTMKPSKSPSKLPLEYTVDQQKTQWFSLYHSLQHYKYHTYLMCKDEIASLRVQAGDLGQEQTVQLCMRNQSWVEGLFDRFGELLNQVQQACL